MATPSAGDPHSPRSSQSPPPEELGAVHDELLGLAHSLYNLGTTVLHDSTKEKPGLDGIIPPKPVGARV
jgi:mediator of RNA polymerase II transcription subunit 10